jgi:hypothetical protein
MIPRILLAFLSNPVGLVAVATPLIISHVQQKGASLKAEAEHKNAVLATATNIGGEICTNMDKLAYFSKQAMFGVVFRGLSTDADKAIWVLYQNSLTAWESSKTTSSAQTEIFFGVECARALKKIQGEFEILISQVEAAYYKRTNSAFFIEDKEGGKNDFRKKYIPVWNRLTHNMTDLSKDMIKQMLDGDVGFHEQNGSDVASRSHIHLH